MESFPNAQAEHNASFSSMISLFHYRIHHLREMLWYAGLPCLDNLQTIFYNFFLKRLAVHHSAGGLFEALFQQCLGVSAFPPNSNNFMLRSIWNLVRISDTIGELSYPNQHIPSLCTFLYLSSYAS